jgi:polysaccharide export outer membrane protein
MLNYLIGDFMRNHPETASSPNRFWSLSALLALPCLLILLSTGCQTAKEAEDSKSDKEVTSVAEHMATRPPVNSETLVLHEGDTLSVTFAGAPDLNTVAVIRRDGRITLKSLGEFKAAGLTPPAMEKELIKLYGPQLQTKEVTVAVQSSAFPVYVTGAVLRPGKILSDRPITALEAIMEAGGFDYGKANLKSIRVLRTQDGRTEHYTLNLKKVLQGQEEEQFALKPSDIIYVPEKFNFF